MGGGEGNKYRLTIANWQPPNGIFDSDILSSSSCLSEFLCRTGSATNNTKSSIQLSVPDHKHVSTIIITPLFALLHGALFHLDDQRGNLTSGHN